VDKKTRRFRTLGVLLLIGALCVPLSVTALAARSRHARASAVSSFKLARATLVVGQATVKRDLAAVSKDGQTFVFRRLDGPLRRLRVGSVLILSHATMNRVTRVTRQGGRTTVKTVPATISQAFKSAHFVFHGAPRWGQMTVQPASGLTRAAAARLGPVPGYLTGAPGAHAAGGSVTIAGSNGRNSYSITVSPGSGRLNFSALICYQVGSVCGNGLSQGGAAFELNLKGYIEAKQVDADVSVGGGGSQSFLATLKNLSFHYGVTWGASRGTGDEGDPDPPTFHVPVGIDIPFALPGPYPVPGFFRIQFGLYLKLGLTSHNAVLQGGFNGEADAASAKIGADGRRVSGDASQADGNGSITPKQSLSLAPTGLVFAFQAPKVGVALGTVGLNALGYIEDVVSVGQANGSAIAGQLCTDYDVYQAVKGGMDLQYGLGLANASKTLFDQHLKDHQC
jgi:hypothetical protein